MSKMQKIFRLLGKTNLIYIAHFTTGKHNLPYIKVYTATCDMRVTLPKHHNVQYISHYAHSIWLLDPPRLVNTKICQYLLNSMLPDCNVCFL